MDSCFRRNDNIRLCQHDSTGIAGIFKGPHAEGCQVVETLRLLCDYFPTAVFTGTCLVFISEDWRVELTEHKDKDFSKSGAEPSIIRVRISKKALDGDFITGHYEDFQLESPGELAEQIEKYVQLAIGRNIREI